MFFFCQDFAIEDVLNEYDVDKDGFITLTEFIGTVRNEGRAILSFSPPPINSLQSACCFKLLFFVWKSGESPTQWEIEESVRFQDLYDQDQNGKLDRDEQLRWVAPNSYGSAREEVSFSASIKVSWKKNMSVLYTYQVFISLY